MMNHHDDRIIWIDVETSGKNPEFDVLLEIGYVLTDMTTDTILSSNDFLVEQNNLGKVISSSDKEAREIHNESGLWNELWLSNDKKDLSIIEKKIVMVLEENSTTKSNFYVGGNSPILDREFLKYNLPWFYSKLSHMTIDVTSIALMFQSNTHTPVFPKQHRHRALPDSYESRAEYQYYTKILNNID